MRSKDLTQKVRDILIHRNVFFLIAGFLLLFLFVNSLEQKELVLLSFDVEVVDGAEPVNMILDSLESENITATFFVMGMYAEMYPNIIERMVAEEHEVACHSYSHPNFKKLDLAEKEFELLTCINILENITGSKPVGFRAPYNKISKETYRLLSQLGFAYDASSISGLGLLFPNPKEYDLKSVPISSFLLLPLEDVIWLYYLNLPDGWYFSILERKMDSVVSYDFHPHHLKGRQKPFRGFLSALNGQNVTFISHKEFILLHNGKK